MEIINKIFKSNNSGYFKVLELRYKDNKNQYYLIEFLETKTQMIARKVNIVRGQVKDYWYKTVFGVACLGNIKPHEHPELYRIWKNIISRCYNKKDKWYKSYGGKGVTVDQRWLCFEYFYKDAILLDGYDENKIGKGLIELDKDLKQKDVPIYKKIYSKDTCIWIDKSINRKNAFEKRRTFKAISPDGKVYIANNQREFAREHNLHNINLYLNNKRKNKKGWKFEYLD